MTNEPDELRPEELAAETADDADAPVLRPEPEGVPEEEVAYGHPVDPRV